MEFLLIAFSVAICKIDALFLKSLCGALSNTRREVFVCQPCLLKERATYESIWRNTLSLLQHIRRHYTDWHEIVHSIGSLKLSSIMLWLVPNPSYVLRVMPSSLSVEKRIF